MSRAWLFPMAVGLVVLLAACSDDDGKEVGTEGGPCFANGTCHPGLTCLSDLCVRVNDGAVGDTAAADLASPDVAAPDSAAADLPPAPDAGAPDLSAGPDASCYTCSEFTQGCLGSSNCPGWGALLFCAQSKTLLDDLIQCMCGKAQCSMTCPLLCGGGAPDNSTGCNNCLSAVFTTTVCDPEVNACDADK